MFVNLLSDTVTKPTEAMLRAMMGASVGDDVFGEDPTVNRLEAKVAELFGREAALFCPSGTMTNQIALRVHTKPLDEVICDHYAHIYQSEVGGYASNAGIGVKLIEGTFGKITAGQVAQAINAPHDWLCRSSLVVLENTHNKGGGSIYNLQEIAPIARLCTERGLKLHLDGARLFNALVETHETAAEYGRVFDSISVCMSKGLGAPVGSLLVGDKGFVAEARRFRKAMGGGMRQAGYLAAACIYALDHHVMRLALDHQHARQLGDTLRSCAWVHTIKPVQSNIVIFECNEAVLDAPTALHRMLERGVKASLFGHNTIRLVTHLDVTPSMITYAQSVLASLI
jgi:threonine aldolase